jgi:DNA-binding NtrC family response regulator
MGKAEGGRIVVVDDEPVIADTLAIIFQRSGYDAMAFYDAASALEACADCAPDLLVSDVAMTGVSGIELAIQVRQRCPECRVLLLSGRRASFRLVEEAKRQGYHFEILEKPIHPVDLLQKVAEALADGVSRQVPKYGLSA